MPRPFTMPLNFYWCCISDHKDMRADSAPISAPVANWAPRPIFSATNCLSSWRCSNDEQTKPSRREIWHTAPSLCNCTCLRFVLHLQRWHSDPTVFFFGLGTSRSKSVSNMTELQSLSIFHHPFIFDISSHKFAFKETSNSKRSPSLGTCHVSCNQLCLGTLVAAHLESNTSTTFSAWSLFSTNHLCQFPGVSTGFGTTWNNLELQLPRSSRIPNSAFANHVVLALDVTCNWAVLGHWVLPTTYGNHFERVNKGGKLRSLSKTPSLHHFPCSRICDLWLHRMAYLVLMKNQAQSLSVSLTKHNLCIPSHESEFQQVKTSSSDLALGSVVIAILRSREGWGRFGFDFGFCVFLEWEGVGEVRLRVRKGLVMRNLDSCKHWFDSSTWNRKSQNNQTQAALHLTCFNALNIHLQSILKAPVLAFMCDGFAKKHNTRLVRILKAWRV